MQDRDKIAMLEEIRSELFNLLPEELVDQAADACKQIEARWMQSSSPFADVTVGDTVTRNLGPMTMDLLVTEITDEHLFCGSYKFSRRTGLEIDPEMGDDGWTETKSGAYITLPGKIGE